MRAVLLAAVVLSGTCKQPDPGARTLADVHGDRALKVMGDSTQVELGLSEGTRKRAPTTWVMLDLETGRDLRDLLLDPDSYDWKDPTMCGPSPRVVARFKSGQEQALVKLCFECDVAVGEVGWGDLGPARARVAEIVKRAFPGAKIPGL